MKHISFFLFVMCLFSLSGIAQETFPVNGPYDTREEHYAFTNATIVMAPGQTMENATMVVKKGKIISIGKSAAPQGAVSYDLNGKTIYPSFIELHSDYGLKTPAPATNNFNQGPQNVSNKQGAYGWNQAIKPEVHAFESFTSDKSKSEALRKSGFGATLSHFPDGIVRGTGALVALGEGNEHDLILKDKASAHYSFSKGTSTQNYPSSLMGTIALLKQNHYDAQWFKGNPDKEYNISLQEYNAISNLPAFFDAGDVLNILRANKLGKTISKNFVIKGNGTEYQRVNDIKQTGAKLIVPINFPKAYDVTDPLDAEVVDLSDMLHWEYAPYNPKFLEEKGIEFALTSQGIDDKAKFLPNIRTAVKNGLSKDKALAALTTVPASLVGASDLGTLSTGKLANFIITDGDIFEGKTKILANWVLGQPFILEEFEHDDFSGEYDLKLGQRQLQLLVDGKPGKHSYKVNVNDSTELKTKASFGNDVFSMSFVEDDKTVRFTGWRNNKNFEGTAVMPDGKNVPFTARYKKPVDKDEDKEKEEEAEEEEILPSIADLPKPFNGYGWKTQPSQNAVLFKNATVWTSEDVGILETTDVLVKNGKIAKIGKNLSAGNAKVVDATGKHLTAGIVDEHAHVAISRGVNEGTQASSAEVSIADVVNSEHVAVYRLLGGGVTAAQLLHGSANPIGGQSALIKMRWGSSPEEMKIAGADKFIKFALGENVKQSNWGDNYRSRYPQTRMGVEQVYIDHFTRALEYEKAMASNPTGTRKDIEMETLLEILRGKRFVTCHSYVQSEINMLMHVAEQFDFNINTFTHILEGYKVADKMKAHGAGGSTFADWWAYKYEVIDAIPYNAALMTKAGLVVAINSDDAEMGRRLNQEAAKLVKYGDMSEEEAWKTVTINPAKLLHLDNRMGSIKEGKDADVVLWSDNPLSVYAKAEQTYVDGRKLFDSKEDVAKRRWIKDERERLIQAMINDKGAGKKKPTKKEQTYFHCNTYADFGHEGSGATYE